MYSSSSYALGAAGAMAHSIEAAYVAAVIHRSLAHCVAADQEGVMLESFIRSADPWAYL